MNLFDKILIIHDPEDFEKDALNISSRRPVAMKLLKKRGIQINIVIKNLISRDGCINKNYIKYLDKCQHLIFDDKNKYVCLDSLFHLEKNEIEKIMTKFNLRKYLKRFLHLNDLYNFYRIEKIILINEKVIDSLILSLILNAYTLEKKLDIKEKFKSLFENYEVGFGNYHIVKWIINNPNKEISSFEELYQYGYSEKRVCQLFYESSLFIEKLADPSHIIEFLFETIDFLEEKKEILSKMVEYILKHVNFLIFEEVFNNPDKLLMKLHTLKKFLSPQFDTNIELIIKFKKHEIKTSLSELLQIESQTSWDDIKDFCDQIENGSISLEEVADLKLKSIGKILKLKGFLNYQLQCCICFESKSSLYLFQKCSHIICLVCLENYLKSKEIPFDESSKANTVVTFSINSRYKEVPCPNCKENTLNYSKNYYSELIVLKVFI